MGLGGERGWCAGLSAMVAGRRDLNCGGALDGGGDSFGVKV